MCPIESIEMVKVNDPRITPSISHTISLPLYALHFLPDYHFNSTNLFLFFLISIAPLTTIICNIAVLLDRELLVYALFNAYIYFFALDIFHTQNFFHLNT